MKKFEHGGDIYGNPGVTLDFSVNTNPLGMPEAVRNELISRVDEFTLYPDPQCRKLVAALAERENMPAERILCGNGAADLIYRLCFAAKPKKALICAPTFSEYEGALRQVDCQVSYHYLLEEEGFALTESILEQLTDDIDMLFLCHPNNPTGRLISPDIMVKVLAKSKEKDILAVFDECFIDFTEGESSVRQHDFIENIAAIRAFTKTYSLAGLRLGYLVSGNLPLLQKIKESGQCWGVSVPAQIAGTASLGCRGWKEETLSFAKTEMAFFKDGLEKLGLTLYPTDANYLLFRCEKPLYKPLLERGLMIRACGNFVGLDSNFYRAGIRKREDNIRLLEAIKEIING